MSIGNSGTNFSTNSAEAQITPSARYSPLPHDGDSFRLLHVLPSLNTNSPVRCELYTSSISCEEDRYIAGSYVWGPPEPKRPILLDGRPFQVRDNLFRFLRAFRSRYQLQVIWLDAICINQDDIQERSHQVQEMKRIYSGAKCVYCWLGYDKPLPHTSSFDRQRITNMYYWCMRDERRNTRRSDQLEYIAQAEYWSRMWIVQEFILAKQVILLVGKNKLSYNKLKSFLKHRLPPRKMSTTQPLSSRERITRQESKIFALMNFRGQGVTFESLFGAFGMLPCSVPIDGVFALLGLVGEREEDLRLIGIIDYSITVWQLLQLILGLDVLELSPFTFSEKYNRFVIKGQLDDHMGGYVGLKLERNICWQIHGPDDSQYFYADGSSVQMAMAIRASRAMRYSEATDDDTIEITMYTPGWRTISGKSGVSVGRTIP